MSKAATESAIFKMVYCTTYSPPFPSSTSPRFILRYPIVIFLGRKLRKKNSKSIEFITTVLSRRHESSAVKVFGVSTRGKVIFPFLDDCFARLVQHRVEQLVLQVGLSDRCDLPHFLFECDSLRSLTLCTALPPPFGFPCSYVVGATSGLRSLHTLNLSGVKFLENALAADLFSASSFPCLVNLDLAYCMGITHLKISCPNLQNVKLSRMYVNRLDISGMRLENLHVQASLHKCNSESWVNVFAPNLQHFSWLRNSVTDKCSIQSFPTLRKSVICCQLFRADISMAKIHSALDLLSGSSQVQNLFIVSVHLQILSKIYFKAGLPYSFVKLEKLTILSGLRKSEIPGLACLFKSSPIVHTLKIELYDGAEDDLWNNILLDDAHCSEEQYWESQAQTLSSFLSHLKVVIISNLNIKMINESVTNVTRFLLEHGRGLQEMILRSNDAIWKDKIDLIEGFPRASADVRISVS